MNIRKILIYLLLIVTVLLSLAICGCKATTATTSETTTTEDMIVTYTPIGTDNHGEYSTFTATGIPLFSFEYPVDYVVNYYDSLPEYHNTMLQVIPSTLAPTTNISVITTVIPYSTITLVTALPPDVFPNFNGLSIISLNIEHITGNNHSDDIEVDKNTNELKFLESLGRIKDLQLIYQRHAFVCGIEGREIKYSYTQYPIDALGAEYGPYLTVEKDIFFDYKGMSIKIELYTDAAVSDKTEKVFEHLLQTFKLLE